MFVKKNLLSYQKALVNLSGERGSTIMQNTFSLNTFVCGLDTNIINVLSYFDVNNFFDLDCIKLYQIVQHNTKIVHLYSTIIIHYGNSKLLVSFNKTKGLFGC